MVKVFAMSVPDPAEMMMLALAEARLAAERGEVPVGAVVTGPDGAVLACTGNRTIADHDPTAHAEIIAIRAACRKIGNERLVDCDLYVTLEPCTMCAGAISGARIRHLHYGASDPKMGGVEHGARVFSLPTCHHRPHTSGGLCAPEAAEMLKAFFRSRRR